MACGLPVIASLVPGITEIMGNEWPLPGIVVPIGDVSALAGAMERLLSDIAVTRIGKSRYKASSEFLAGVRGQAVARFSARTRQFVS